MARLFCVVLLLANGINCYCYLLDLPSKTFLTINMKKMFFHITAHLWCTRKSFRSLWCLSIALLQSFEMIFFYVLPPWSAILDVFLGTSQDLFIVEKSDNFHILDLLSWVDSIPIHAVCVFYSFSTKQIQSTGTKLFHHELTWISYFLK